LVFYGFLNGSAEHFRISGTRRMPASRPPDVDPAGRLALIDLCKSSPERPGIYRVIDLSRPGAGSARRRPPRPLDALATDASLDEIQVLVDRAEFLVFGKCAPRNPGVNYKSAFLRITATSDTTYWMRKPPP
jgi:hypothetical protein